MKKTIVGFFIDEFNAIKPKGDTTVYMMLEAKRRGFDIGVFHQKSLTLRNNQVEAEVHFVDVFDQDNWYQIQKTVRCPLNIFDHIFFRKDPPVDQEYLYSTHLLELVERQGVPITNRPSSISRCNEKLFAAWFAELLPPTIVSTSVEILNNFVSEHEKVVLKTLDGYAGKNVYLLEKNHPNTKALLKLFTQEEQISIMLQTYLPEVMQGDKRILMIHGEAVPYALLRTPQHDDFRANLAAGGSGTPILLSAQDLTICERLKPVLQELGLNFVGIDVIGNYLTEVNVTSPTGARTLDNLKDCNTMKRFFDGLKMRG